MTSSTCEILEDRGLLLASDPVLPSVAALVAGAPVNGSWWSHPKGREIFRVLRELEDDADVAFVKLVAGKVTLVHRRLWSALYAAAASREAWQLENLSAAAKSLLSRVEKEGRLAPGKADSKAARELEARLLVLSAEVHTETGAHVRVLESWKSWAKRVKLAKVSLSAAAGKGRLEEALGKASGMLPWR